MTLTRLNDPREITDREDITEEQKDQIRDKERFKNLVKQLPGEATGIYLAGMSFFAGDMLWLTIAALVGLIVLVWVRYRANVSRTIWLMSLIGYVVWIYAIGEGPLQAGVEAIGLTLPALFGAFLVTVYSTVVVILTATPPKKG